MTHSNGYQRISNLKNDFKYNGKEEVTDLGLDWYDYGARMYMADIGRWGVIDKMADLSSDWTPYRYAFNNPLNLIDPTGNYEISVTLSKDEKNKLREEYGKGKEYRQARSKLIEGKKQDIRNKINAAKSILDSNETAKSLFSAFSGIEEGSTEWTNLWEENGQGPVVKSDGAQSGGNQVGYEFGGNVNLNPDSDLAEGAFTLLHEYVHVGDTYRSWTGKKRLDGTANGHPDFNANEQRSAFQGVIDSYLNDPRRTEKERQEFLEAYKNILINGKATVVEIGYAFEKKAFGDTVRESNLKQMSDKFLPKK